MAILKYKDPTTGTYKPLSIQYIGEGGGGEPATYITPEQYGAVGNGTGDDSNAINQAISYANAQGKILIGAGTYRCTSPIIIDSRVNISLNYIKYYGNDDAAVIIKSSNNEINIFQIESQTDGIDLISDTGYVCHNVINIDRIVASHNCISFILGNTYPIYANQITWNEIKAGGDGYNCIMTSEPKEVRDYPFITENQFFGGKCSNADWAFYGNGGNSKFLNMFIEGNIKGGFCFVGKSEAYITGDRHWEGARGGEYPFIKLVETANHRADDKIANLFYTSVFNLPINEIDVSNLGKSYTSIVTGQSRYYTSEHIGAIYCRIGRWVDTDTTEDENANFATFCDKAYVCGGALILCPTDKNERTFTQSIDMRTVTKWGFNPLPSRMIIGCADCRIDLHSSYCPIGIDTFEVVQTQEHTCKIYDWFTESCIFDGTNLGAGTYEIKCVQTGNFFRLNGDNIKWGYRKIPDFVTTLSN